MSTGSSPHGHLRLPRRPPHPPTSSTDTGTTSSSTTDTTDTTTTTTSDTGIPPTSSSAVSSSSAVTSSSSIITTSSSAPSTQSSSAPTSSAPASVVVSPSLVVTTGTDGNVVTHTAFETSTVHSSAATATSSNSVHASTKGFLQNKGAVAATFTIVGLVAAGILFALVTTALRRRRARRFDREIAEEAKRVPPPVFMDDEDYTYGSAGGYGGGGGYSDYANAAPQTHADPYAQQAGEPYPGHGASSEGYGAAHSDGHPTSEAVHSGGGTPSNYMYPSGYSDLGFSDVSSHGTYAQPPMDAYGNHGGYGGGFGAGAAGAGAAAAMGMAGAYEMTGYGHAHQGQVGSDWHAQAGQPGNGHGGGYMYPGEDAAAAGYPPTATSATAATASDPSLARNKSASGARSLAGGSFGTPTSEASSGKGIHAVGGAQPQYADGYVNQYQTHMVDDDAAYGGMHHSQHGHVGEVDDDPESDYGEDNDVGPRVLKVANE
ncbi:hypothetical protein MSAN_01239900 [Mycena sanguinolenta]|uniref:Uncharacterized protein n=1 Tax=Mycena sanguinolenta TaxID=230812 RepID=A0A8H6YHC4_9AGAR|nr:hypothetical protein MSAN_01239900 [Mycena sanguinolenta]